MNYGKLNEQGYLMSSQKKHDDTWLPLGDFVTDANGDYYTYYLDPQTPDVAKNDAIVVELTYQELLTQLSSLTVSFNGNTFSGSNDAQSFIVNMLTKIEGESPQATRNIYAIDGRTRVPMTKTGLLDLLSAIDVAQEAITNL